MEEIAAGVRRLGTRWVNWYLLEDEDGPIAIDSGFSRHRQRARAGLDDLARRGEPVRHVVLTHWHPDHTGCAEWLRTTYGATVWAPQAEAAIVTGAERARVPNFAPYAWRPTIARYLVAAARDGGLRRPPVAQVTPYVPDATELPGGLRAIATPGHTPGHCSLVDERRGALFAGDALATVDFLTWRPGPRATPPGLNRDHAAALRSLESLEAVDLPLLLPGHGDPWREGVGEAVRRARRL